MKVISLSEKAFKKLQPMYLEQEVFNTEAEMYIFQYRNKEYILKKLNIVDGNTFANKLYTVEMLNTFKSNLPNNFCIPTELCSINGEIIGFTIPKVEGVTLSVLLNNKKVFYKEQLYYLKKIGDTLRQLQYIRKYTQLKNIYINDLHSSNFIVDLNNKDLTVIDLDSCKICNNDPSPARYLTPFSLLNNSNKYKINHDENLAAHIIADENSDIYCYCIMILEYLFGRSVSCSKIDDFYKYINFLDEIGVNKELVDCFNRILANCDNINPSDYLEEINGKQFTQCRKFKF